MKYKDKKRYYFAFGSNLKHDQMLIRCPHAVLIGPAKISGWRLDFGGYSMRWRGGTATIVQDKNAETWGAVYQIDNHCVKKLDRFETVHLHFYHHRKVGCKLKNGDVIKSYTYVKNKSKTKSRLPSFRYINQIETGALECHIPKPYINNLSKFYPETKIQTRNLLPSKVI